MKFGIASPVPTSGPALTDQNAVDEDKLIANAPADISRSIRNAVTDEPPSTPVRVTDPTITNPPTDTPKSSPPECALHCQGIHSRPALAADSNGNVCTGDNMKGDIVVFSAQGSSSDGSADWFQIDQNGGCY